MEIGYFVLNDGRKVELPEGIEVLNQALVSPYQESLVEVYVPDSVVVIGDNAFANCQELRKLDCLYAYNLQYIGKSAFDTTGITGLDLRGSDVRYIGNLAFYECSNLLKVELSDHLEMLGTACFAWCENLLKVDFRGAKVVVGQDAFAHCNELSRVDGGYFLSINEDGNDALNNLL